MPKPLKSELHHWWPRSLSRFWADADGGTNQLSWDGKLVRSVPAKFGANTNAHHIKLAKIPTVWDTSFESVFGPSDARFSSIIEWLESLSRSPSPIDGDFSSRLIAQTASHDVMLDGLADCLISLIVRGPAFRNLIRLTIEQFHKGTSTANSKTNDTLVAMNMQHCLKKFSQAVAHSGKYAVLYSEPNEFIFGDGFLHNFSSPAAAPLSPLYLVPLTPSISVLYAKPMTYSTYPRIVTMRLRPDEVRFLNDTVQIYSRDFLYFRTERPAILPEFSQREFLQYPFHNHPWLDQLVKAMTSTSSQPKHM